MRIFNGHALPYSGTNGGNTTEKEGLVVMKHAGDFLLHTLMVVHTAVLPIAGILGITGFLAAFSRLPFYNETVVSNILNPENRKDTI